MSDLKPCDITKRISSVIREPSLVPIGRDEPEFANPGIFVQGIGTFYLLGDIPLQRAREIHDELEGDINFTRNQRVPDAVPVGKRYVVGFPFNEDESGVTLLRKNRPPWQAGKLNGAGGHVEPGETYDEAMVREGMEECGISLSWECFASIHGDGWTMHCYVTHLADGQRTEDFNDVGELFETHPVSQVTAAEVETIPNLRWLVPMAMGTNRSEWPYVIQEKATSLLTTPQADSERERAALEKLNGLRLRLAILLEDEDLDEEMLLDASEDLLPNLHDAMLPVLGSIPDVLNDGGEG